MWSMTRVAYGKSSCEFTKWFKLDVCLKYGKYRFSVFSHPLGERDKSSLLHATLWRFASLLECSHCALHGRIQGKWSRWVTLSNSGRVWKGGHTELNLKTGYKSVFLISGNALPVLDIREMLPFFMILPLDVWLASKGNALAANRRKHCLQGKINPPHSLFGPNPLCFSVKWPNWIQNF